MRQEGKKQGASWAKSKSAKHWKKGSMIDWVRRATDDGCAGKGKALMKQPAVSKRVSGF